MLEPEEITRKMEESGKFVMLSTRHLRKDEVASFYYKRQEIEQLFDVKRNCMKSNPLRVHSMEVFKGHLLFTFLGTVVSTLIRQQLLGNGIHGDFPEMKERRDRKLDFSLAESYWMGMFGRLANQGCINYGKRLVPDVPNKTVNDIYKFFGIESPNYIQIEKNGNLKIVRRSSSQN